MAFYKINQERAGHVQESGAYINKSGMYPLTILAAMVSTNEVGARTINFYVDIEGTKQPLYCNLRLDNNDGTPSYQVEIFDKLMTIANVTDIADPLEAELPIGKEGANKDVLVLDEFTDLPCIFRVQFEYGVYNNSIIERKNLKMVYAEDKTSADEIINGTEKGIRYTKDEKYAENVTYKDNLTAEIVEEWINKGRPEKSVAGGTSAAAPARRRFGQK